MSEHFPLSMIIAIVLFINYFTVKKFNSFHIHWFWSLFTWYELKCNRGDIFIILKDDLCSIFYLSRYLTLVYHYIGVMKIDNNFLSASFFFVFSSRYWCKSFRNFSIGCEWGFSTFYNQRGYWWCFRSHFWWGNP